jgi:hypothetical protein
MERTKSSALNRCILLLLGGVEQDITGLQFSKVSQRKSSREKKGNDTERKRKCISATISPAGAQSRRITQLAPVCNTLQMMQITGLVLQSDAKHIIQSLFSPIPCL